MKRTWIAMLLLVAVPVLAGRGKGDFKDRPFPTPQMVEKLKLTDAQVTDLKKLHEKHMAEADKKRSEVKDARKALEAAMEKDTPEADLWKLQAKVEAAHSEMGKMRFSHMLEVRKILTPEQRKEFKKAMKDRMEKRGHRGPPMRDGDEGPSED